jgi:cell division GTPase FtsZ
MLQEGFKIPPATLKEKHMVEIKKYIEEIFETSGFINIDNHDVDNFLQNLEIVDAIKVHGQTNSVEELLADALKTLQEKNSPHKCIKILFSIKSSNIGEITMDDMNKISEVLSQCDEEISVVWGLSTNDKLNQGEIELIILCGFDKLFKRA